MRVMPAKLICCRPFRSRQGLVYSLKSGLLKMVGRSSLILSDHERQLPSNLQISAGLLNKQNQATNFMDYICYNISEASISLLHMSSPWPCQTVAPVYRKGLGEATATAKVYHHFSPALYWSIADLTFCMLKVIIIRLSKYILQITIISTKNTTHTRVLDTW